MPKSDFAIIGAGLAGTECALVLASYGFNVVIFEQKPDFFSPAHSNPHFAELVCSNSLRSNELTSAPGLLKREMSALGSFIMGAATANSIPAGKALAVDRENFAEHLTNLVLSQPGIRVIHKRISSLDAGALREYGPYGVIVAAGPLASEDFSASLAAITGQTHCYFYDAIAPVIWTDTVDRRIVFRASRYEDNAPGDYLNCPINRDEYEIFYNALCQGKTCAARDFEREQHFEGCMPIEALASRGPGTLTFGPFKPVGLIDPRTGQRPWAVLQLRPENVNMEACNLVGCQTKLLQAEQKRIFRLVPGLEHAEFARYGSMHRNTFVNAPVVLNHDLSLKKLPGFYLAGQISGVEGYIESAASGLWLAHALAQKTRGKVLPPLPEETALGALLGHLRRPAKNFQPSNVMFGLMPAPAGKVKKKDRKDYYARRAQKAFTDWLQSLGINGIELPQNRSIT